MRAATVRVDGLGEKAVAAHGGGSSLVIAAAEGGNRDNHHALGAGVLFDGMGQFETVDSG